MPDLGQTTTECVVGVWIKQVGERVERGDTLVEVETDKTVVPVEAFCSGYLRKIVCPSGSTVVTGAPIAILSSSLDEPVDEAPLESPARSSDQSAAAAASPARRIDSPPEQKAASALAAKHERRTGSESPRRAVGRADAKAVSAPTKSESPTSLYEMMLRIRRFEERVYYLFLEGGMPGTIHLYLGQEAIAAGVCASLNDSDFVTSTHRAHGHALAKGVAPRAIMAELFGKQTGCCGGKGGSMHVGDMRVGMVPSLAVVGAGIPIAAGLALAAKRRGNGQVAVCFFGDGAANEGTFHEGLNMAAVWDLPVVYVCENNQYGASTHVSKVMKLADVASRAAAYGMPGQVVDGNDVNAVRQAAGEAIERARHGAGPTLLECKTYRYSGHSRSDPGNYRPKEEVALWKERDPLTVEGRRLLDAGVIDEPGLARLQERVDAEIEDAVEFARASAQPAPDDVERHVYWEGGT